MMNPGPIEEVGQTTRSFFETMKGQPATLALMMSNVCLLVFIFYALVKGAEFRDNMVKGQFEYQREISALLAKCIVPGAN
jgi:hypothetical protein